ncbi:dTDP-4-dehydrorhamnose reductase family protein [Fusobacterium ulcerans]|uniref:dTDP-4-dehydrorhamnose reductase family protein n=1 Tax=Fusobacterium ulcerans TaxID=861 RepID=UPI0026DBDA5A|nr:SDR family oxidoreductase [Fusobacterium ulcerans]
MEKILIIGSKGMAGHMIKEYLYQKKYDVYGTLREKEEKNLGVNEFYLDAFDKEKLEEILKKVKPDFVINCIGILNQFAENNPDIAIYVNGYFPHYLDRLSEKYGYKLIHITTDCVFSGKKGNYIEDDFRDADNYYGRSKAIGEVNNNRTLTFRTSIIGPDINKDGIGLFNWFMKQEGKIMGYSNVFWSGVTTLELAKAIEASFSQNLSGLIHLVNNEKISKYDLLKLFSKYMNKDIEIEKYEDYFSDKSLIRTKEDFSYKVPKYEKMIEELSEWIKKNNRYVYR